MPCPPCSQGVLPKMMSIFKKSVAKKGGLSK